MKIFLLACQPFGVLQDCSAHQLLYVLLSLCSENLSCRLLSVSPMYWLEHFLQVIQYTRFLVLQFNSCVISAMNDVAVALIFFPCCIKGHIGHPLDLFIPGRLLFGRKGGKGGTLALIILSLILGALL